MDRLKLALIAVLIATPAAAQQCGTLITCPPASTPLAGTELLYVVQGGVSKKMTVTQLGGAIAPLVPIAPGQTPLVPSTSGGLLWDNNGVLADSLAPLQAALLSLTTSQLYGGTGVAGVAQAFPLGMNVSAALQQTLNAANGLAGLDASARLAAAQFPTLSGDVTTPGGSLATTLGAFGGVPILPTGTGSLSFGSSAGTKIQSLGVALFSTAVGIGTLSASGMTAAANANSAFGAYAMYSTTAGFQNAAFGTNALEYNTSGNTNAAFGAYSLQDNTTGAGNTGLGYEAAYFNSTGSDNVAVGLFPLYGNTTGSNNVAVGGNALNTNTAGSGNTAVGANALFNLGSTVATLGAITPGYGYTNGTYNGVTATIVCCASYSENIVPAGQAVLPVFNVVVSGGVVTSVTLVSGGLGADLNTVFSVAAASIGGTGAGFSIPVATLTTGQNDVAIGDAAANAATLSSSLTAIGAFAANKTTTGNNDVAIGTYSLFYETTGSQNEAIGGSAGQSLITGSNNVLIGFYTAETTLTTGNDNILICTGATACDTATGSTSDTFGIYDGATAWIKGTAGNGADPLVTIPGTLSVSQDLKFANLADSHTAPTISSGCGGGSPSISAPNGTAAFVVTIGTASGSTCAIAMPTATNGWICSAEDTSNHTTANSRVAMSSVPATNLVTVTDYSDITGAATWVAGAKIAFMCRAY